MRTRYTLLAGASVLALAMGALGASGGAAAQATTAHAKAVRALGGRSHVRLPTTAPSVRIRPDYVYYTGRIQLRDNNVLNAAGCAVPANVIEYPYVNNGCAGNANEIWYLDSLQNGNSAIYAYYSGHRMCLNVKGGAYGNGTQILAWGCDNGSYALNEQFYLTNAPYAGWSWIHAAGNGGYCLNSAGGLGTGHNIVLYYCGQYNNEYFTFPG